MAALVAGVQYGLSSHSNFPENKSLIFVKLTDSAQRAIEDFLRNGNTTNQNPTIQFLGNEGQLSFPSTQSSHGSAGFTFSLSGNQDIEGPQGGFECIQQTGLKSLESLGTLPWKMRIQANDDVYETTRHRMAVAEENNKNKCTRVIKANGPDIGRKVKVKAVARTIQPITNTRHRESTSIPTPSSQSSRPPPSVQAPVSSTTLTSSSSSSTYKPMKSNNPPPVRQHEKKCSDIMRRPLRERLIHLLALRPYKRPELYDRINKEGIKERDRSTTTTLLKQVACMKDNTYHLHRHVWNDVQEDWPFYTEQEKAMLKRRKPQNLTPPGSSDGGSSGSGQSPNSTHPGSPPAISAPPPGLMSHKRPGYYQSADGLQTKRPRISHFRKSDAGPKSVSGGSNNANNGGSSNSRDNARTTGGSVNSLGAGGLSASVVSGSGLVNGSAGSDMNGWDHRQQQQHNNQNTQQQQHQQQQLQQQQQQQQQQQHQQQQQQQQHRGDYRTERTTNSEVLRNYGSTKSCLTPTSDSEDNNHPGNASGSSTNNPGGNHHSHNNQSHNNNTSSNNNHHHNHHSSVNGSKASLGGGGGGSGNGENNYTGRIEFVRSLSSSASVASMANGTERRDRDDRNGSSRTNERAERERERGRERETAENTSNNSATSCSYNDLTNLGASRYTGNSATNTVTTTTTTTNNPTSNDYGPTSPTISSTSKNPDYPDYLTYYTTISSTEQRRRYKDEFNADYEEYRRLHAQVAKVSKRFAQLEERRRREIKGGNREKIEEIELQIWQEYNETKSDPVHTETKKRFDYLHEKLSHLKRLVHEYDTKNSAGNGGTDKICVRNGVVDVENSGSLRY